ncbi:MAG: cell division protein FtsK, partial [Mesorhizobium sp.]
PGIAVGGYPKGLFATIIAIVLATPALWLFAYGSALIARKNGFAVMARAAEPEPREQDDLLFDEDEDEGDEGILALGAITHWWLSFRAWMHRRAARRRQERDEFEPQIEPRASAWRRAAERVESAEYAESRMSPGGRARVEPEFFAAMVNDRSASVD